MERQQRQVALAVCFLGGFLEDLRSGAVQSLEHAPIQAVLGVLVVERDGKFARSVGGPVAEDVGDSGNVFTAARRGEAILPLRQREVIYQAQARSMTFSSPS